MSLYSESGAGKSMSALLLARGFVGPQGNIQLIDTEAGRGELYSDVIPGGYNVIPFTEPFSPERYIDAVRFAEQQGATIIVIDQMSAEWDGVGSVLDMATQNEDAGKKGLSIWKAPKMAHAKMMVRLLQSPCPIIICLRAKYKSRQVKQNGKTEIVKDEMLTPIQDEAFIFESTVHGYITHDHCFHPTKISHPTLGDCFPDGKPITLETGQELARWCTSPGGTSPLTNEPDSKTIKASLWKVLEPVRGSEKNWNEANEWLWDNGLLIAGQTANGLTGEEMSALIIKVKNKLAPA